MIQQYFIFENDDFIAINKPAGMLSIPDRTQSEPSLKDHLLKLYGSIFVVHRLDKDTSGIVLFAKNEATHKYLSQRFENREVEKYYLGIVIGKMQTEEGIIEAPIMEHPTRKGVMIVNRNGKASTTGYTLLQAFPAFSLVQFRLFTGRTHQLRVHCKHIEHPLCCDAVYGDGKPIYISSFKKKYKAGKFEEEKPMLSRLALHSYRLIFSDENGLTFNLTAPPPKEFNALMQQLKKNYG